MAVLSAIPWLVAPGAAMAALRARGAHALLLHGPAGIGKWQLAVSFAGAALCEHPGAGGAPCGACASCRLVAAGNHPDLRVVVPDALAERRPGQVAGDAEAAEETADAQSAAKSKPSREIKIDQILALAELIGVTTHRGGIRVVVLGPADALNPASANALLKSLEEPPPGTLYLLVTDRIDRCLPTIVSRCALVRIPIPKRASALAWLEARGVGEGAAQRLVEAGGGPFGALHASEAETPDEARSKLLGLLRRGSALEAAHIAAEVPRTVAIGPSVALFQRWVWDYFSYCTGAGLRYHPHDEDHFHALAGVWSLRAAAAWWDSLGALRAVSDHPLNARAAVEGAMLEYAGSISSRRDEA